MTTKIETQKKYRDNNREKIKERAREHYHKNKEAISQTRKNNRSSENERSKTWRINNPEKVQENNLKKFGISLEDYKQLCEKQNNKCAICNTDRVELSRNLCVDHDHVTLKVRGLLCDTCNRSLGLLKDNIEILRSAIKYLESNLATGEICPVELTNIKE